MVHPAGLSCRRRSHRIPVEHVSGALRLGAAVRVRHRLAARPAYLFHHLLRRPGIPVFAAEAGADKTAKRRALSSSSGRLRVLPGSPLGSSTRPVNVSPTAVVTEYFADPLPRVRPVHFRVQGHAELPAKGDGFRCIVNRPRTPARRPAGEWRLVHVRRDFGDVVRRSSCCSTTCSRASAAGWVWRQEAWYLNEVSARAQHSPSLSTNRTGVGAAGHTLPASQDAAGTGETALGQVRRREPVRSRLGGVQLLGVGGVPQKLPKTGGLRARRADPVEHPFRRQSQ